MSIFTAEGLKLKVLLKRALVQVCVITVVCLLASIIGVRQAVLTGARPAQPTHTVVIDAGHGGLVNTID